MTGAGAARRRRLPRLFRGVRGRMLALLLTAGVPVIGIAVTNAVLNYDAALSGGLNQTALLRAVAAAQHGAALESMQQMVEALVRDPVVANAEAGCDAILAGLRRVNEGRYANLWVIQPDGALLCSALPATRGTRYAVQSYLTEAIKDQRFTIGSFIIGGLSRRPVLTAGAPVLAGGQVVRVVAASLELDFLLRRSADEALPRERRIWLLDRFQTPLSLTGEAEGDLPEPALARAITSSRGNWTAEGHAVSGAPFAYASTTLSEDLRVLVGMPTTEIRAAARSVLLRRLLELAAFLAACLVAIMAGVDLAVVRPLRKLADRVRAWRPGAPFLPASHRGEPDEVLALEDALGDAAAAIAQREAELSAALQKGELLMGEIHHRVKNNLQIVASLLNLHANRLRDPRAQAEFAAARDRVQALATLHRHLYMNHEFEAIALGPFLEELARQLFDSLGEKPGGRIGLSVEAEPLEIVTDQAVSLALLVTEAVTNAVKHGFPQGRAGHVWITVRRDGEEVELVVRDDGVGIVGDQGGSHGIGMTLIEGFAAHLAGESGLSSTAEGTVFRLRFTPRRRSADEKIG
jgi:two-component sensor histidine kinase